MTIRYVVLAENVLGVIYPEQPNDLFVLRSSILRGGPTLYPYGVGILPVGPIRDATLQDFADFGVQPPTPFLEALRASQTAPQQ